MNIKYIDMLIDELDRSIAHRKASIDEMKKKGRKDAVADLKKFEGSEKEMLVLLLDLRVLAFKNDKVMELSMPRKHLQVRFVEGGELTYRERCLRLIKERDLAKFHNGMLREQVKPLRGKIIIEANKRNR